MTQDRSVPPAAGLPILLLAAAAFVSLASARVIDPLLHVIAVDFNSTIGGVSIVVAAYTLPYGLFQIVLGPLGDRFGKLRVLGTALAAFAVATGACALAGSLSELTLLRAAAGAASATIIPTGMAYIADAVPYADRQVTLSRYLNGTVMAQMLAGPIGGICGDYIGWRGVFVLFAACGAFVSLATFRQLRRLPDRRDPTAGFQPGNYATLLRPGIARLILLGSLLDGMLLMGAFPFLAPYMSEHFALSYTSVGVILACFGIGAFIYTRTARYLVPRLGEAGMVSLGAALLAGGIGIGMTTPHWAGFIPVELMLGCGFFLVHGVLQARGTEMLPNARATAMSSFAFALFMGQSLGAIGIGTLIQLFGFRTAFVIDAIGILALGLWLRIVLRGAPR